MIERVQELIGAAFTQTHAWVFEHGVQPWLFSFGAMRFQEEGYLATEWFLLGMIQIFALYVLVRPLERFAPAEHWENRQQTRVDFLYTALNRLGLIPLAVFLLLSPVVDDTTMQLRDLGITPFQLEHAWTGVTDIAVVGFLLYLVVLDFTDYWVHRAQHRWRWWWALHAVHHSQRQMSLWTDDRNHLLDEFVREALKACLALAIGVEPAQFVGLLIATRMLQSLQHANVRWSLGPLGRLIVSPIFHRRHHAIGVGHEGRHRGCNFAVLFPLWDMVFRTADYSREVQPTGIRDQLDSPDGAARDYGQGFWAQQRLGVRRMINGAA